MKLPRDARALGMDCAIPRRDFLNGIAIGIAGTVYLIQLVVREMRARNAGKC